MQYDLPNVIGFTGGLGAGKDYAAKALEPQGFVPVSFADELRDDICRKYNVTLEEISPTKPTGGPLCRSTATGCASGTAMITGSSGMWSA